MDNLTPNDGLEGFKLSKILSWYNSKKEGFQVTFRKTKEGIYFFFQNRWRF